MSKVGPSFRIAGRADRNRARLTYVVRRGGPTAFIQLPPLAGWPALVHHIHIQPRAAWAPHDCFSSRARPAGAIATPRGQWSGRAAPLVRSDHRILRLPDPCGAVAGRRCCWRGIAQARLAAPPKVGGENGVVRPALGRDDRRDSDVAEAKAGLISALWFEAMAGADLRGLAKEPRRNSEAVLPDDAMPYSRIPLLRSENASSASARAAARLRRRSVRRASGRRAHPPADRLLRAVHGRRCRRRVVLRRHRPEHDPGRVLGDKVVREHARRDRTGRRRVERWRHGVDVDSAVVGDPVRRGYGPEAAGHGLSTRAMATCGGSTTRAPWQARSSVTSLSGANDRTAKYGRIVPER